MKLKAYFLIYFDGVLNTKIMSFLKGLVLLSLKMLYGRPFVPTRPTECFIKIDHLKTIGIFDCFGMFTTSSSAARRFWRS